MGLEGFENTGNSEQKESLNLGLSSLNDTQSIIKNQARNYVLREQKYGIDSSSSITDINSLLEHQQSENESLEKQVQLETREFLDKEILINEAKTTIYEMLGINNNQELNSSYENFTKGFVDELVIGNYEMAIEVINTKGTIIIEALKQLVKWEVIKQMAVALGESVVDLFSGNSYEKGKSVAELGLITIGAGVGAIVGKKGLKYGMKKYAKNRVNKENLVSSPDLKDVIGDVNKKVDNIVPKKQFDFEGSVVEDIAKLGDIDRIEAGSFYLKKQFSPEQEKAILQAHNIGDSGIGNYSIPELKQKVEVLQEAGFESNEIRTLLEKGVCGKDKYPEFKNLYDDPIYDYLSRYKEILGEKISIRDVLGEGVNGIVLRHPVDGIVIKIRKPGMDIDDIGIEISNHNKILLKLKELKGGDNPKIDNSIKVPKIREIDPGYLKTFFTMEKIDGQTLSSRIFRNEHSGLKLENPDYLDSLTDRQIIELMTEKYGSSTESLKKLREDYKGKYLDEWLDGPEGSKLKTALKYLKESGIEHTDLHTGNIMIDKSGNIYIIDFGTAKVNIK